ncbi:ABC transporter ATP-binding protein [Acuticoccus kandeliae]|uniref:ABC transporter ATP-binding protein n=1 Tax=Acuticoccus kandeliae TaxID=2073160 RepID=UPI000D3EC7C3|nr:ABC transporter ATP-binding protein [Acuticoccus kandeliae]
MRECVLGVDNVTAGYGKIAAVTDVSLNVHRGEAVALLGGNGAGKTTLLNTISGFLKANGGAITMEGAPITGLAPHRIVHRGVIQVSQGRHLFGDMSVIDNLSLNAVVPKHEIPADLDRIFDLFPRLDERREQRASSLSGGEQQMLAIGRALMTRPRILMLDEPSGGLAPKFVAEIASIARRLKESGATMLLVEQNIGLALEIADRVYVMRAGRIVDEREAAELNSDRHELAQRYYL